MRIFTRMLISALFLLLLTGSVGAPMLAQTQLPDASGRSHDAESDARQRDYAREQMKAANKKRQEDIKRDTDKLLQLATELKAYVDKTNENVLSIEVLKKAEEIERLSKEVQKKMRSN